ncbi:MAG TPA: glycosyltransferase family 4 protein [Fimbriimonas sp.]|nr:glycosyltransferase family 4 protein [Fimbriimonas sp.]
MDSNELKVVQICSAREAIYGAVRSLITLAQAQREAGTEVEFITFAGKRFGAQVRKEGFAVREVRVRGKVDPLALVRMRAIIRARKYDVVHTHLSTSSVNGALAARMAGVPSVATVHGMSGKLSFVAADHLIAVSNGVKEHLIRQGVKPGKVTVVYNGLETNSVPPNREEARRKLGLRSEIPIVGTVSRITRLKGIDDALRAVARLRPQFEGLRYLVVGDGEGLEFCRQVAAELGIADCVDFVGYRHDVSTYLAAMDLFLFPSLKEAMGIALVEAMAAGLPIVATNVGGIPEVVTSETGMLVGPSQPDALALATQTILNDPVRRLELGESARLRAQRVFSIEAMEQATEDVYRKLLDRPLRLVRDAAPVG